MNIALVDPIAATPAITPASVVRPRVPSLHEDPNLLRETNLVELGAAMANLGHSVTVVLGDVYLDEREQRLTSKLVVVPVGTFMRSPFHPALLPLTPTLVGHAALSEADVIQSAEFHQPSTFFACMAAREAGVPVVVWQETFAPMQFPGSWYQRAYELTTGRYVRGSVDRYVPRTTSARGYLTQLHVEEADISAWTPTGIDLRTFVPRTTLHSPEDFGWETGDPILLLVARLHRSKGVDIALRILRWLRHRNPKVRLLIRGSGPELENLRQIAGELGVQDAVRFVGRVSREEMVSLYNLADIVLCTSRNDLLPYALIEASSCGRACVTRNIGAVKDIVIDGQTGLVVEGGDAEAFGRTILSLLQDDEARTQYGIEARRRMEQYFDLTKVAPRLVEVYRGVCG